MDILIRGATIIDGRGEPSWQGSLSLAGGTIRRCGRDLSVNSSTRIIDAHSLVAAPGFIDIHSHSDFLPLIDPMSPSKLHDGVTLEVAGNCGLSAFPLSAATQRELSEKLAPYGIAVDWLEFSDYRRRLLAGGTGLNHAFLVGHGTLRAAVMEGELHPAKGARLQRLCRRLEAELASGALGLSVGLEYTPGCFADQNELKALAAVVARRNGLFSCHLRDEGATLIESLEEILEITRETGVRTLVSHLKAYDSENWPKIHTALAMLRAARTSGLPVYADRYPYTAANTDLAQLLPRWARACSRADLLAACSQQDWRRRVLCSLRDTYGDDEYFKGITIADLPEDYPYPDLAGRNLYDEAARRSLDPREVVLIILRESQCRVGAIFHGMCEENLRTILSEDFVAIASDSSCRAVTGPGRQGHPHPRAFGTFARVLGRLAIERQWFTLEEAIRRMTSLPATILGLSHRGCLEEGMWADVTLFDPNVICDTATYGNPFSYSRGFEYVFVRGVPLMWKGERTGKLPGRVIGPQEEWNQ